MHHVFAEFLGTRVGIIVGTRPINRFVFAHDFILACSRHGNGGHMRIAAQTMVILNAASQLDYFQRATQIYIEALLLGFSIERSGAVEDGVRSLDELLILAIGKAKAFAREVAAKNSNAGGEVIAKFGKFEMKLQRLPQAFARFLL